jgi:hypothetical protein
VLAILASARETALSSSHAGWDTIAGSSLRSSKCSSGRPPSYHGPPTSPCASSADATMGRLSFFLDRLDVSQLMLVKRTITYARTATSIFTNSEANRSWTHMGTLLCRPDYERP